MWGRDNRVGFGSAGHRQQLKLDTPRTGLSRPHVVAATRFTPGRGTFVPSHQSDADAAETALTKVVAEMTRSIIGEALYGNARPIGGSRIVEFFDR